MSSFTVDQLRQISNENKAVGEIGKKENAERKFKIYLLMGEAAEAGEFYISDNYERKDLPLIFVNIN